MPQSKNFWNSILQDGLRKTRALISHAFSSSSSIIDEDFYNNLSDALLMADVGVSATEHLLQQLSWRAQKLKIRDVLGARALLLDIITEMLTPLEKSFNVRTHKPIVILLAGVNGAGKTTSIGKLVKYFTQERELKVLLAAADTFRAAAREQLSVWAKRGRVEVVGQNGIDPASVSFDAIKIAQKHDHDVVMIDTAGRLHTQIHLMQELEKICRVISKAEPEAPHEKLLVIDGSIGQNALIQVKAFHDAIKLTGLIVTKLDGTAKGGVLCALVQQYQIPVYFIGVGEGISDLQPFGANSFTQALLS